MQTNSPKSDHKNEVGSRHPSNRTPLSPSSSFFIIQEPSNSVISPTGGSKSPPKLRRSGDESASKSSHKDRASSSSGKKKKLRFKSPTSAPTSPLAQSLSVKEDLKPGTPLPLRSTSAELTGDHNSVEAAVDGDTAANTAASAQKRPADLSILNRCGSAPQLPLYSPTSASVYSSSKKRALQSSTNGASPHLVALQRSRLTPLPAKPPSVDVKQDPSLDNLDERNTPQHSQAKNEDQEAMRLCPKDPLLREKVLQDAYTIASLKQRLVILEREASTSTKARHAAEKQIEQLTRDNSRLYAEKTHHEARVGEMDRVVLRQRHEFDKLAARYAAVYASLQKLVDQQQHGGDNSALQTALQALARENQDFLRKLRVLEARHIEDKTLASNQEKKIKRLRAEMEALRHMSDANNRGEDFDESSDVTQAPAVSRLAKPKKYADSDGSHDGRPGSASSPVSLTSSAPKSKMRPGSSARLQTQPSFAQNNSSHLVSAEAYQYIDPNILKVLEKGDSQFSITNAINLSVVLKKWLNSCVHVVCSTHLPTVLQVLLKRICELLHCEHAALFTVDHAGRKLVGVCSERSAERWELPLDKGIAGYAARHNMICNVHRATDDPRSYSSTDSITGTVSREVLAVPIVHELQVHLEAHLATSGDNSRRNLSNMGVFAVLRAWNTTHQKPFSPNDQILGTLLSIQAGIILRQTAVTKTLQKINHKMHQILHMQSEIVTKAWNATQTMAKLNQASDTTNRSSAAGLSASLPVSTEHLAALSAPSVVQLVATAQKELAECLGIRQLRIFVLDADAMKLWHVGEQLSPQHFDDGSAPAVVRCYVNAQASLCALVLHPEAKPMIVTEPSAEAAFNDTVDIPGGARGLYLIPIPSPWGSGTLPFGIVQVSRVAKARMSASPFALTASEAVVSGMIAGSAPDAAVNKEREAAQQTEDKLMMELVGIFCRVFAGLLHHANAQYLYDTCPPELQQAQLSSLNEHLANLAPKRNAEDHGNDNNGTFTASTEVLPARSATAPQLAHNTNSQNIRRFASADPKPRSTPSAHRVSFKLAGSSLATGSAELEATKPDVQCETSELGHLEQWPENTQPIYIDGLEVKEKWPEDTEPTDIDELQSRKHCTEKTEPIDNDEFGNREQELEDTGPGANEEIVRMELPENTDTAGNEELENREQRPETTGSDDNDKLEAREPCRDDTNLIDTDEIGPSEHGHEDTEPNGNGEIKSREPWSEDTDPTDNEELRPTGQWAENTVPINDEDAVFPIDANSNVHGDTHEDVSDGVVVVEDTRVTLWQEQELAPDQGTRDEEGTAQMQWSSPYEFMQSAADGSTPLLEDEITNCDEGVYSSTLNGEQPVHGAVVGYTWEEGGEYDPTSWSAAGYNNPYDEEAMWEYEAVEDPAPGTAESDSSSMHRESNHISTDSSYAIDMGNELVSSRNTSSAEPGEPHGAL